MRQLIYAGTLADLDRRVPGMGDMWPIGDNCAASGKPIGAGDYVALVRDSRAGASVYLYEYRPQTVRLGGVDLEFAGPAAEYARQEGVSSEVWPLISGTCPTCDKPLTLEDYIIVVKDSVGAQLVFHDECLPERWQRIEPGGVSPVEVLTLRSLAREIDNLSERVLMRQHAEGDPEAARGLGWAVDALRLAGRVLLDLHQAQQFKDSKQASDSSHYEIE